MVFLLTKAARYICSLMVWFVSTSPRYQSVWHLRAPTPWLASWSIEPFCLVSRDDIAFVDLPASPPARHRPWCHAGRRRARFDTLWVDRKMVATTFHDEQVPFESAWRVKLLYVGVSVLSRGRERKPENLESPWWSQQQWWRREWFGKISSFWWIAMVVGKRGNFSKR